MERSISAEITKLDTSGAYRALWAHMFGLRPHVDLAFGSPDVAFGLFTFLVDRAIVGR